MPNIYCTKCGTVQKATEKTCGTCGARYGGSLAMLLTGSGLAIGGPILVLQYGNFGASTPDMVLLKAIFYWALPILVGTLCVYDSNGKRVAAYLYGGGALIALGVYLLNS